MELTGLLDNVIDAVVDIDFGRNDWSTRGKAEEGRISYEIGIDKAMSAFRDAASTADPYTLILAEYTFINQEFQFCGKTDKDSLSSLTQAIQSFDDAFLVLEVVEDSTFYQAVEKSYPHKKKFRVKNFPKDSFHDACSSHRTRLQNILRSPGIDPIEKTLLKQRFANLSVAQNGYIGKQKKALTNEQ